MIIFILCIVLGFAALHILWCHERIAWKTRRIDQVQAENNRLTAAARPRPPAPVAAPDAADVAHAQFTKEQRERFERDLIQADRRAALSNRFAARAAR